MDTRIGLALAAAVAALLAGFALPFEAYLGLVALAFVAVVCAIALIGQIGQPFLGLALLVVTAIAFPVEFPGPSSVMMSSTFPLAAIFCGLWLLRVAVVGETAALERSRAVYAVLAFIGVTVLAFAIGQFPWFPSGAAPLPAQIAELALFLLSGFLFLAVGHQLTSMAQLKALTALLVLAGFVTCVLQMVPSLHGIARWTTRPGSVGSLFWTWLAAMAFAQALFNRRLPAPVRLFLLSVTGLVLFHGLVQVRSWASGWVPAVAAVGIILFLRLPRLSFGLGLVAVPVGLVLSGLLSSVLLGEEEYSLMTRQEAWIVLWQLVERSPLFGTGLANYYYFTENFPILGWYVRFISHNNYQDLLVQTGLVGLLVFGWLAFELFVMTLQAFLRAPAGFPRAYAAGALGGLVGSLLSGMLGDWIIPFYYNAGILGFRSSMLFWVFLGGVLAMRRMLRPEPAVVPARRRELAWPADRRELARAH